EFPLVELLAGGDEFRRGRRRLFFRPSTSPRCIHSWLCLHSSWVAHIAWVSFFRQVIAGLLLCDVLAATNYKFRATYFSPLKCQSHKRKDRLIVPPCHLSCDKDTFVQLFAV